MIRLVVSKSRLRLRDVIRAEQGLHGTADTVDFLARFAQNEDGEYLEHGAAVEALMDVTLDELGPLADEFALQVKAAAGSPLAVSNGGS